MQQEFFSVLTFQNISKFGFRNLWHPMLLSYHRFFKLNVNGHSASWNFNNHFRKWKIDVHFVMTFGFKTVSFLKSPLVKYQKFCSNDRWPSRTSGVEYKIPSIHCSETIRNIKKNYLVKIFGQIWNLLPELTIASKFKFDLWLQKLANKIGSSASMDKCRSCCYS